MSLRLTLDESEPVVRLRCRCSEIIVKSQDGADKIRAKILIIKGNQVFAICKRCSTEVPLPLQRITSPVAPEAKSDLPDLGPRLILSK